MTPDKLLSYYRVSSQSALARRMGRPVSTVADWFQTGRLPKAVLLEIQVEKLKAKARA